MHAQLGLEIDGQGVDELYMKQNGHQDHHDQEDQEGHIPMGQGMHGILRPASLDWWLALRGGRKTRMTRGGDDAGQSVRQEEEGIADMGSQETADGRANRPTQIDRHPYQGDGSGQILGFAVGGDGDKIRRAKASAIRLSTNTTPMARATRDFRNINAMKTNPLEEERPELYLVKPDRIRQFPPIQAPRRDPKPESTHHPAGLLQGELPVYGQVHRHERNDHGATWLMKVTNASNQTFADKPRKAL